MQTLSIIKQAAPLSLADRRMSKTKPKKTKPAIEQPKDRLEFCSLLFMGGRGLFLFLGSFEYLFYVGLSRERGDDVERNARPRAGNVKIIGAECHGLSRCGNIGEDDYQRLQTFERADAFAEDNFTLSPAIQAVQRSVCGFPEI